MVLVILLFLQSFVSRGVLTDVTLVAGDTSISCHRLLLSASSDYFAAMFTGGMVEQNMDTVEIQGVDGGALRQLVDYCYAGKLDLQEDTVENVTAAACLLQLPAVIEACCAQKAFAPTLPTVSAYGCLLMPSPAYSCAILLGSLQKITS